MEQIFLKSLIIQMGLQQIDIQWFNFHHLWLLATWPFCELAFGELASYSFPKLASFLLKTNGAVHTSM